MPPPPRRPASGAQPLSSNERITPIRSSALLAADLVEADDEAQVMGIGVVSGWLRHGWR